MVDPDSFITFQTDLLDKDSELLALKKSNSHLEKSLRDTVEELAVFEKERDGFENEISKGCISEFQSLKIFVFVLEALFSYRFS